MRSSPCGPATRSPRAASVTLASATSAATNQILVMTALSSIQAENGHERDQRNYLADFFLPAGSFSSESTRARRFLSSAWKKGSSPEYCARIVQLRSITTIFGT